MRRNVVSSTSTNGTGTCRRISTGTGTVMGGRQQHQQDIEKMKNLMITLQGILIRDGYCCTAEEADAITDSILIDIIDTNLSLTNEFDNKDNVNKIQKTLKTEPCIDNNNNNKNGHCQNKIVTAYSKKTTTTCIIGQCLQDYLDLSEKESTSIVHECVLTLTRQTGVVLAKDNDISRNRDNDDICSTILITGTDLECDAVIVNDYIDFDDSDVDIGEQVDDEDDVMLCLGDTCEICDHDGIKLTKHHLIPKETYKKVIHRLCQSVIHYITVSSCNSKEQQEKLRAKFIEHDQCFDHIIPLIVQETLYQCYSDGSTKRISATSKEGIKIIKKSVLQIVKLQTIDICRPCHSMIHKTHDNIILATNFNTLDKLLQDDSIVKFAKWCHRQRKGTNTTNRQRKIIIHK